MGDCLYRSLDGLLVQPFFVEHHIGLDEAPALTAGHAFRLQHVVSVIKFPARLTVIPVYGSVELVHLFTACQLVQAVDILGNDRRQLSLLFQFCQSQMGVVGLNVQYQHLIFIIFEKFFGMRHEKTVA